MRSAATSAHFDHHVAARSAAAVKELNMWIRQSDDTVTDQDGKVMYFGLERFVRDICLGVCCFVCGAKPGEVTFNDEHVIPKWLLRKYNLFARKINLANGTTLPYDRYTVPCCEACNTLMGRVIEEPMRQIIDGGFDAVDAYCERHGSLKFYVWMGLIFLKIHLKDRQLRAHLDMRKAPPQSPRNCNITGKGCTTYTPSSAASRRMPEFT
jgi:hypothetical protein